MNTTYSDIMRLLLCLLRYHKASQLFANIYVSAFQAVFIRNLIFNFITRLNKSENAIIQGLVKKKERVITDLLLPYGNIGTNYLPCIDSRHTI